MRDVGTQLVRALLLLLPLLAACAFVTPHVEWIERCWLVDTDGDGSPDEDELTDPASFYADGDGDGYGADTDAVLACSAPTGYVAASDEIDCDDADAAVHPSAAETCDGVDQDCDSAVDEEATDAATWYIDTDSDGFGVAGAYEAIACDPPSGYVETATDCDDTEADIHPGADESCDGVDQDCDDLTDEDALDAGTWYADSDGDGFGADDSQIACDQPNGFVAGATDCDDSDPAVYPEAPESCGGDEDCDGVARDCDMSLVNADGVISGAVSEDRAGSVLAGVGDASGSRALLIGVCGHDAGGDLAGAAYFIQDPSLGEHELEEAGVKLVGEENDDFAGCSVADGGDVNADGEADLLIGAWNADRDAEGGLGLAYLVLGPVTSEHDLSAADARFTGVIERTGWEVAGAGDVDDDGYDDVLIGALGSNAESTQIAYLVSGPVSGDYSLASAKATFTGETAGDHAGYSLASAGDTNGDGNTDLLIGAFGDSTNGNNAGAAYLLQGPVSGEISLSDTGVKFLGESTKDKAGEHVASAGDLNDDGYDDLLISAPELTDGGGISPGGVYVVFGDVSGDQPLGDAGWLLYGQSHEDDTGHAAENVGDVDGDGHLDLLIGAPGMDDGGSETGGAWLVLGPVSGAFDLADRGVLLRGQRSGDRAGVAVAGLGDIDGDGRDDLVIGAEAFDADATDEGAVYLVLGDAF